jgi:hypothetical protein
MNNIEDYTMKPRNNNIRLLWKLKWSLLENFNTFYDAIRDVP